MKIAIITKSATTSSGARAPIDLASALGKYCDVTIFAQNGTSQKNLRIILYKNIFDLYLALKKGSFDIISFHSTLTPLVAARLTGIPIVRTYYGTQFDAYFERLTPDQKPHIPAKIINSFANSLIWANQKIMVALSDRIIAISQAAQKELKKLYRQNSQVIYLGSSLKPKNVNPQPGTSYQVPVILSVSRITPYKGFHQLIEIVNRIREKGLNVKLIIAGSGERKNYLAYLKRIKDPQDQIIASPSDQTLKKLYAQCDIFASYDRYPFFGLPLLEAAQFAKPVVAANYLAAKELVTHAKTGYLANSMEEFKKYLKILLKKKSLRIKMGKRAQTICREKFNIEKIAKSYLKVAVM